MTSDFSKATYSILQQLSPYVKDRFPAIRMRNPDAKRSRNLILPPCLSASERDLCIFSRLAEAARFADFVLARLLAWNISRDVAVSVA